MRPVQLPALSCRSQGRAFQVIGLAQAPGACPVHLAENPSRRRPTIMGAVWPSACAVQSDGRTYGGREARTRRARTVWWPLASPWRQKGRRVDHRSARRRPRKPRTGPRPEPHVNRCRRYCSSVSAGGRSPSSGNPANSRSSSPNRSTSSVRTMACLSLECARRDCPLCDSLQCSQVPHLLLIRSS